MASITAKDIMYPRMSLPTNEAGSSLINKLTCPYPGLPVVNEDLEVMGIVSEYDVFTALKEGRTVHEFSAESIMSCGHAEHGNCMSPVTVQAATPIEEIVGLFLESKLSVLPVVEGKKLIGLITRKSVINVLAEKGYWKEHELQQRVHTVSR
ncbi:MAG: CBS domain-containing protein [Actinomycetota bacterium]|nr:CBS domain-containing protein [Actinomycetota bacterium]